VQRERGKSSSERKKENSSVRYERWAALTAACRLESVPAVTRVCSKHRCHTQLLYTHADMLRWLRQRPATQHVLQLSASLAHIARASDEQKMFAEAAALETY
jgi:hypothetical protein